MKKHILILALVLSSCVSAFAQQPQDTLWCIGHRSGRLEFDENTLQGFKDSYDFGMRGFETDIRMTRDGRLVIMHDAHISRVMDGTGIIEEHDWEYFRQFRSRQGGNPIPTLDDLLGFFNGKPGLYVEFELKTDPKAYPHGRLEEYCDKVYDAIYAAEPAGSCYVISSFDLRAICYLIARHPESKDRFMPIFGKSVFEDVIETARTLGVTRVAAMLEGTSRNKVRELRDAGVQYINLWPVKTPEQAMLAVYLGSNILCLDAPRATREFIDQKAPWLKIRY